MKTKHVNQKQMSRIRLKDLQKSRMTKEYESRVNYSMDQMAEMVRNSLISLKKV